MKDLFVTVLGEWHQRVMPDEVADALDAELEITLDPK
jgi:hypothetical protein